MIQPVGTRVVLRLPEAKTQTEGGIVLPEQSRKQKEGGLRFATVEAVGPECPGEVRPGDRVLFAAWGVVTKHPEDSDLLVVAFEDVYAVVESAES